MSAKEGARAAYFECLSGISGDMCLAALIDAGAPLSGIKKTLSKIPVKGYSISATEVKRGGIRATMAVIEAKPDKSLSALRAVEAVIKKSGLDNELKSSGFSMIRRIFEAESRVHGIGIKDVHLHELSATDTIIDVFGTLSALRLLNVDKVYASAINLGSGFVKTAHGELPVPAPATAELLRGAPVYGSEINRELTTPTGAAIISSIAESFGPMPEMKAEAVGIGAGAMDIKGRPNVLRVFIGGMRGGFGDEVAVVETNIDDMNPQIYEYVMERLLEKGALDVFITPVIMKKGRPGVLLTVLCAEDRLEDMSDIIFTETTTIGIRHYKTRRKTLGRRAIKTAGGGRLKEAALPNGKTRLKAEYEDAVRFARKTGMPLQDAIKEMESLNIKAKKKH